MKIKCIITDGTTTIDLQDSTHELKQASKGIDIREPQKEIAWGANTMLRDGAEFKELKHKVRDIIITFDINESRQLEALKRNFHKIETMIERARMLEPDLATTTRVKLYIDLCKGVRRGFNNANYLPEPTFGKGSIIFDIYDATFSIPQQRIESGAALVERAQLKLKCSALGYGQTADVGVGTGVTVDDFDGSIYIDANAEYIDYPTSSNIDKDQGSLSIWWKPDEDYTYANDRFFIDCGDNFKFFYDASEDKFALDDGTNIMLSTAQTFAAGDLIHLVINWNIDPSAESIYIDGVLDASDALYVSGGALATDFTVGNDTATKLMEARGYLYDLRIWDEELNTADIPDIYDASYGVTELPFITDDQLENTDDADHDAQADFYNIPGDVDAITLMHTGFVSGGGVYHFFMGTRTKDPTNFVHIFEAENGTLTGFASAGGSIPTDSNDDHVTIAALGAGNFANVVWASVTNRNRQYGKFRAFARCMVTGTDAEDYIYWHLEYGTISYTEGLVINDNVYHTNKEDWELLDLGEVIMPPYDPPYEHLRNPEHIYYKVEGTNPAGNPNTAKLDIDFLFLIPIDENMLYVDALNSINGSLEGIYADGIRNETWYQRWTMPTGQAIGYVAEQKGEPMFLAPHTSPIRFYALYRYSNFAHDIATKFHYIWKIIPRYLIVR